MNNTFEIPKLKQKSSIGYQENKLDLSMERKDKEEGMLKKIYWNAYTMKSATNWKSNIQIWTIYELVSCIK